MGVSYFGVPFVDLEHCHADEAMIGEVGDGVVPGHIDRFARFDVDCRGLRWYDDGLDALESN